MELFYLSIAVFACIAVESSLALQCFECTNGQPGLPASPNCADPFNGDGISAVNCDGQCFATTTSMTTDQGTILVTERGCQANPQECANTCAETPQGRYCSYCCEGDMCNAVAIEETASGGAGGIQCYQCNEDITDTDPAPGSCASDDFSGEGGAKMSCAPGKCISVKSPANGADQPATFSRMCDTQGFCQFTEDQIPPGTERTCCDTNLCNVGSNIPVPEPEPNDGGDGGDVTTDDNNDDDDDDDKEGTIQCWQCDSKVANVTDEQTVCYTGMFPADDIKKIDCPSGKCLSYEYPADDGAGKMFSRGCLTPQMEQLGLCNGNSNATCCTSNLCNKGNSASAITASVATIISAVFVVACPAFK